MSTSPFQFFRYQRGMLTSGGVPLAEIVKATGTPVYVYSADALLAPLRALQAGLRAADHLICFAVKSNSNIAILKLLAEAGAGADLVSGGELFRARKAGVPANRVVLSGVGKTRQEIMDALDYDDEGIFSFNVESEPELRAISAVAKNLGKTARVALRFNPDVDPKTHPYISTGLKKNKFGIHRQEVLEIARNPEKYPNLRICGISIHIGSQLLSLSPLRDAFKRLSGLLEELGGILPRPIEFVDIGGGIGITYKAEKAPALSEYCKLVLNHFGPRSALGHPLKILLEPGRVISGNAGVLITQVLYRKERRAKDFLIVDAAMNDLMRPALYGSYHEIVPLLKRASGNSRRADVVGPICESSDCFGSDRKLSPTAKAGDLFAILSAGAYGFSMSSTYNSRPRPPEVLISEGRFRIIRDRETYEDLIRGETL